MTCPSALVSAWRDSKIQSTLNSNFSLMELRASLLILSSDSQRHPSHSRPSSPTSSSSTSASFSLVSYLATALCSHSSSSHRASTLLFPAHRTCAPCLVRLAVISSTLWLEIDIAILAQDFRACDGVLHSHFPTRWHVYLVLSDLRGLHNHQLDREEHGAGRLTLNTLRKYLQFVIKVLIIPISLYHH